MALVIDASILVSWALTDETHPTARLALERVGAEGGLAPTRLWFEIRNALIMNERRGRISAEEGSEFLRLVARSRIEIDGSPDEEAALVLARTHRLTFYDAIYLELARREGSELATLDRELARAAKAEGVSLLG